MFLSSRCIKLLPCSKPTSTAKVLLLSVKFLKRAQKVRINETKLAPENAFIQDPCGVGGNSKSEHDEKALFLNNFLLFLGAGIRLTELCITLSIKGDMFLASKCINLLLCSKPLQN